MAFLVGSLRLSVAPPLHVSHTSTIYSNRLSGIVPRFIFFGIILLTLKNYIIPTRDIFK